MTDIRPFVLKPTKSALENISPVFPVQSIETKRPTITGEACCLHCDEHWTAVAPLGTTELQCPNCKLMRGAWLRHTFPDMPVLTCNCGNSFMLITESMALCARCLNPV